MAFFPLTSSPELFLTCLLRRGFERSVRKWCPLELRETKQLVFDPCQRRWKAKGCGRSHVVEQRGGHKPLNTEQQRWGKGENEGLFKDLPQRWASCYRLIGNRRLESNAEASGAEEVFSVESTPRAPQKCPIRGRVHSECPLRSWNSNSSPKVRPFLLSLLPPPTSIPSPARPMS